MALKFATCPHCQTDQPIRASGRLASHARPDGEACNAAADGRATKLRQDGAKARREQRAAARRQWRRRKHNSIPEVEHRTEALGRHLERYGDLNSRPNEPASDVTPNIVNGGLPGTSRRH